MTFKSQRPMEYCCWQKCSRWILYNLTIFKCSAITVITSYIRVVFTFSRSTAHFSAFFNTIRCLQSILSSPQYYLLVWWKVNNVFLRIKMSMLNSFNSDNFMYRRLSIFILSLKWGKFFVTIILFYWYSFIF